MRRSQADGDVTTGATSPACRRCASVSPAPLPHPVSTVAPQTYDPHAWLKVMRRHAGPRSDEAFAAFGGCVSLNPCLPLNLPRWKAAHKTRAPSRPPPACAHTGHRSPLSPLISMHRDMCHTHACIACILPAFPAACIRWGNQKALVQLVRYDPHIC